MAVLNVLRVFCAANGSGGNPLGVFLDGADVQRSQRQAIAAELGYAETVFVDDRARGAIQLFTPELELPLAGHPLVGTAWLLAYEGTPVERLRPPAGETPIRYDGALTWAAGRPEWCPPFEFVELRSPDEVEALSGPPHGEGMVCAWAWIDEASGLIRDRVFVPEAGVPEDEATGSAAIRLTVLLGREIEIRQGRGSVIYARPAGEGYGEIGGRVAFDHSAEWAPGDGRP